MTEREKWENEREKWENELIGKQPVFESKADAIKYALENYDGDTLDIFQEPDGGKYVAANWQAFETLFRRGYTRIVDITELSKMHSQYTL